MNVEEIEAKVKEIWPGADSVKVEIPSERTIHITLAAMYEAPGRSLKQLILLSEFFGTTEIEDLDNFGYPGCESCGDGSKYGVTLEVVLPADRNETAAPSSQQDAA